MTHKCKREKSDEREKRNEKHDLHALLADQSTFQHKCALGLSAQVPRTQYHIQIEALLSGDVKIVTKAPRVFKLYNHFRITSTAFFSFDCGLDCYPVIIYQVL